MHKTIIRVAMAVALVASYGKAYAFHSGGVAECGGCHTMHGAVGQQLLAKTDASSTCLNCHESATDTGPNGYHISTADTKLASSPPLQRTPGGDFSWLKRTYGTGGSTEKGQAHGHNIIAADYSYTADTSNTAAPGGTFVSAQLACNSCHDQHGQLRRTTGGYVRTGLPIANSGSYGDNATKYPEPTNFFAVGVYRILRGTGDTFNGASFTNVFVAKAPATYNQAESTAATQVRVAYGQGTEQWCGTCHTDMHSSQGNGFYHPAGKALGDIAANYQQYVSSGIMTGGTGASSFTSLVPFAQGTTDYAVLAPNARNVATPLAGPASSDEVTCMSCHRAHATGFAEMVRWQIENEFLTKGNVATGAALYCSTDLTPGERCALNRTSTEVTAAYYDRPATMLGAWQRSLCNKCHAKD